MAPRCRGPKSVHGVDTKVVLSAIECWQVWRLKILPDTQEVTTIGGPYEGDWLWHGGILSEVDGNVYAIPSNAKGY